MNTLEMAARLREIATQYFSTTKGRSFFQEVAARLELLHRANVMAATVEIPLEGELKGCTLLLRFRTQADCDAYAAALKKIDPNLVLKPSP